MIELKEEYNKLKKARKNICTKIVELETTKEVMEYKKLMSTNRKLKEEEDRLYRALKTEEFDNCNHILVITESISQPSPKGNFNYNYCGCIKCGLDEKIVKNIPSELDKLKKDEKIQYEYLHKHQCHITGIETNITCGVDLANYLYEEITNKNEYTSDEELIELFIDAYHDLKAKCKPTEEPPKTR